MKAILTYHSIDASGSVISTDESVFRTHMQRLASQNIAVVPLARLAALPPDSDAVALTFDDGFANFEQVAWPILRDLALPVTVFIVSDYVGATNAWGGRVPRDLPHLPLFAWEALARMAEAGVEIGSHTRSHANLRLTRTTDLVEEIEAASECIRRRTAQSVRAFAYPYGAFAQPAVDVVRRTHDLACTTEMRFLRDSEDPMLLPRLDAYYFRRAGLIDRWGSLQFRRYLWLRARGRALRQAFTNPSAHA